MLQRLLLITLTLCSLSASAQWQQTGSKVRYVNGLGIPTKDTAAGVAADSSQILIRPADSSLYIKYKRTWVKVGAGGGGTIGGSGTTNYIPKFTAGTTIGNSQIFDNGTEVGIGTTTPAQKLQVVGNIGTTNGILESVSTNVNFGNVSAGFLAFLAGSGVEHMRITSGGDVGINQTAPAAKFVVNGTTLINTNTNNGVDALQVTGSAKISSRLQAVGGARIGEASSGQTLSFYLGGSNDAYSIAHNAYVVPGVGWKYLGNGPGSVIGSVSGDLYYWTNPTNSSGADANLGTFNQRFIVTAAGNFGIGTYAAPAAKLAVEGTTLINTNTDNGVDELQVNGSISGIGFKQNYVTKTGAYTATNDDYVIDCTSGTFTVTLPASSGRTGRILIIKNSGAGTITVDGNASETIDGAATYSLAVQYATVQIMSDGTNWKIIAKF
jgi:hypothetical protein